MNKILFSAITCLLMVSTTLHAGNPQYSVTVLGEYGYNSTWEHFGGAEVRAYLPVNPNVDLFLNGEALSSNMYTGSFFVRPKMPLPVGELFFDAGVLYSAVCRNRTHDFTGALSFGYRMDYVEAQFGCFTRTIASFDRQWNSEEEMVTDPYNLLYRVAVRVQPLCNQWNLWFGFSDYTELEFERMWQPIFFIGAYYDFLPKSNYGYEYDAASHFRLLTEIYCKPTGMFHLDASFYGIKAKVGFAYKF